MFTAEITKAVTQNFQRR